MDRYTGLQHTTKAGHHTCSNLDPPAWLQAVLNSVINHQHIPVRVNGPVGGESILSENYDQLLLVAGGVGVSLWIWLNAALLL